MIFLNGEEETSIAKTYFNLAAKIALQSTCYRSKGGSVIVKEDQVIGTGFNSPPQNQTLDHCLKDDLPSNFKSDKTCCIHAEQRAIMDALRNNPNKIKGSRIYFIRLDKNNQPQPAGKPYCTICSKMALDVGITEYVLWHQEGICVYDADEYNRLSFQFKP